jgi:predicted RNA-binding Zn ribbon-like protein
MVEMRIPVPFEGHADTLPLRGEVLCLDFANTVDPRHSEHAREFLAGYDDLAVWAGHADAVSAEAVERLRAEARERPAAAEAAYRRAIALRQTLYAIFSAVAAGRPAPERAVAVFNEELAEILTHARVVAAGGGFGWAWEEPRGELDAVLWPIARSAADLLTGGRLDRVRECPGEDGCGWHFLDTSRNGSRRWCSMEEGCGSRAKTRRQAARRRRRD